MLKKVSSIAAFVLFFFSASLNVSAQSDSRQERTDSIASGAALQPRLKSKTAPVEKAHPKDSVRVISRERYRKFSEARKNYIRKHPEKFKLEDK